MLVTSMHARACNIHQVGTVSRLVSVSLAYTITPQLRWGLDRRTSPGIAELLAATIPLVSCVSHVGIDLTVIRSYGGMKKLYNPGILPQYSHPSTQHFRRNPHQTLL